MGLPSGRVRLLTQSWVTWGRLRDLSVEGGAPGFRGLGSSPALAAPLRTGGEDQSPEDWVWGPAVASAPGDSVGGTWEGLPHLLPAPLLSRPMLTGGLSGAALGDSGGGAQTFLKATDRWEGELTHTYVLDPWR